MFTDRIMVAERAPRHQVQIFSSSGQYLTKFGSRILQSPRAITVDATGNIIVVESRVMRILVFDEDGTVKTNFYDPTLQFPIAVAVNDFEQVLVCDNHRHSVHVYNYVEARLEKVSDVRVDLYPVGVAAVASNILAVSNYGKLKLTVSAVDGNIVSQQESLEKFNDCVGVVFVREGLFAALTKDGDVFLFGYTL